MKTLKTADRWAMSVYISWQYYLFLVNICNKVLCLKDLFKNACDMWSITSNNKNIHDLIVVFCIYYK